MEIFKAGDKTYAIVDIYSSSGKTCDLLFLTASKDKDIEQWKKSLEKLDNPKNYHSPPKWVSEEEEKFWKDWVKVWEPDEITPGETRYALFVNVNDKNSFLYRTWDIEGDYHTSPGRYYISFEPLKAEDKIQWKEGTWRYYEQKEAKISDLVSEKVIEKAIEEHLKAIEQKEKERKNQLEQERKLIETLNKINPDNIKLKDFVFNGNEPIDIILKVEGTDITLKLKDTYSKIMDIYSNDEKIGDIFYERVDVPEKIGEKIRDLINQVSKATDKATEIENKIVKTLQEVLEKGDIENIEVNEDGYIKKIRSKSDKGQIEYEDGLPSNILYSVNINVDGKEYKVGNRQNDNHTIPATITIDGINKDFNIDVTSTNMNIGIVNSVRRHIQYGIRETLLQKAGKLAKIDMNKNQDNNKPDIEI